MNDVEVRPYLNFFVYFLFLLDVVSFERTLFSFEHDCVFSPSLRLESSKYLETA